MSARRMMLSKFVAGAFGLALVPGLASAQDRPATGPSTGAPETNKTNPANPAAGVESPMPKSPAQILPAIPATATDPAPPGTRSVRVDQPAAKPGMPATKSAAGRMAGPKTVRIEGMVVGINKKGQDFKGETIRIVVDPSKNWEAFTTGEPITAAEPGAPAPAQIPLVLTYRTYVFAHARTADGQDLVGAATESAPTDTRFRSDASASKTSTTPSRDPETSWANIKEGSFVSVNYRKIGELNEALNLSLIELPLNPSAGAPAAAAAAGRGAPSGTTVPEVSRPVSAGVLPR